jgi:predicted dehydrogenase
MSVQAVDRRQFMGHAAAMGAALTAAGREALAAEGAATSTKSPLGGNDAAKRIRVGIIGCGSVSGRYLPHLTECPYAEIVSVCDIIPERAAVRGKEFRVANQYPHIDMMLAGAPFDLLVNLTDMQEHERLNRQAIEAGRNIWSEKPIANSLAAGQELLQLAKAKGVRVWGAPVVVASPQFAAMAKAIAAGELGAIASAKADYGHTGPDWSAFFYKEGGGSMPDLGVYNLTTLTGLLGPAKSVAAMTSIVTPTRKIYEKGEIKVEAEDNAMVLLDHGDAKISCVQCGFNFFNPHGHEGKAESRHTVAIYGSRGSMGLVGYDWEPLGVDVATEARPEFERRATDAAGYVWQQGASEVAECLATGKEPLFTPEHALHVVEIMTAARESQRTERRIPLTSTFKWPVVQ